jgi:hypothetical protein
LGPKKGRFFFFPHHSTVSTGSKYPRRKRWVSVRDSDLSTVSLPASRCISFSVTDMCCATTSTRSVYQARLVWDRRTGKCSHISAGFGLESSAGQVKRGASDSLGGLACCHRAGYVAVHTTAVNITPVVKAPCCRDSIGWGKGLQRNTSFPQRFLCLSRACLGKTVILACI